MMTVKDWDASKAKALKDEEGKFNGYFEQFEKLCSDDGKFTRSGKTTGELHLFSVLFHMKAVEYKTEFSPKLQKFYDRVAALDGVKKCCEEKSKFGEIGNYVLTQTAEVLRPCRRARWCEKMLRGEVKVRRDRKLCSHPNCRSSTTVSPRSMV